MIQEKGFVVRFGDMFAHGLIIYAQSGVARTLSARYHGIKLVLLLNKHHIQDETAREIAQNVHDLADRLMSHSFAPDSLV